MKKKSYNLLLFVYISLLSLLVITRLIYEGTGEGGIWNYIQIFFVISGLFVLVFNYHSISNTIVTVKIFGLFSIYIWFLSIFSLTSLSYESLFYFLVVPYGFMVFIVFYHLGLKTDFKLYKKIILVTFFIVSFLFAKYRIFDIHAITIDKTMVINSYYPMALLPLLLVYIKKKYAYIPFSIVILLMLLSGKRAGMLAISIMLIIFYLGFSPNNFKKHFWNIFSFVIILFASYYANSYLNNLLNIDMLSRLERLLEDGGSGRDAIWSKIIENISNTKDLNIIFGHGFGSTAHDIGIYAHNDFLQIFYEYGFFAFVLYICFYLSMISVYFKMVKYKYPYSKNFAISIVAALFLSSFSYFIIEPRIIAFSALSWGLMLSDWNKFSRSNLNYNRDYVIGINNK